MGIKVNTDLLRSWRFWLVVFALAGGIGFGFTSAVQPKKEPTKPPVRVAVATVAQQDVPVTVELPGNVIAYETVAVRSRIDSQIVAVLFNDGDAVKAGQVLFRLDDRSIKAQIRELEASVNKDKAQLENARLQYERLKALVQNNFVSQSQADAAQANYSSQQAGLKATQASLDNARVQLSFSTITAPIDGRAGTINVTLGNTVKANDASLVTINRIRPIGVQFAVPERYYAAMREAMKSEVVVSAVRKGDPTVINGKLEYIDNKIDTSTGSFVARANFANEQEALWPGMFLNVTLQLGLEKGVLTVPAEAIQGEEADHFVFRVVEGEALRTPVKLQRMQGSLAIIESGLTVGDVVITDGLLRVTDGGPVVATQGSK